MINGAPTVVGYSASQDSLGALMDGQRLAAHVIRRENAQRKRLVYENKFDQLVLRVLSDRFATNIFNKLRFDQGVATYYLLLRDVLSKICTAYRAGATFTLRRGGESWDPPEFRDCMRQMDYSTLAREVELKARLYGQVLCMPHVGWAERIGMRIFSHTVYTPETFDLIPDPGIPGEWRGIILYHDVWRRSRYSGKDALIPHATLWFRDRWELWAKESSNSKWDPVESGDNPYGTVPGVLYRASKDTSSLWPDCDGDRLADCTIDINAWNTYERLLAAGYVKVLITSGDSNFPDGQNVRHAGLVTGGKDINAITVADLTVDIAGYHKAKVTTPVQEMSVAFNLAADEFQQHAAESGAALAMRYRDRDKQAEEIQPLINESLEEQWELDRHVTYVELGRLNQLTATVIPIRGITKVPLGETPETQGDDNAPVFDVKATRVSYPETPQERIVRITFEVATGITTIPKEVQKVYPEMTEDEAEDFVRENKITTANLAQITRLSGDLLAGVPKAGELQPYMEQPGQPADGTQPTQENPNPAVPQQGNG